MIIVVAYILKELLTKNILFNHEDIDKIFCIGYSDDEQKNWSKKLLDELSSEKIDGLLKQIKEKESKW